MSGPRTEVACGWLPTFERMSRRPLRPRGRLLELRLIAGFRTLAAAPQAEGPTFGSGWRLKASRRTRESTGSRLTAPILLFKAFCVVGALERAGARQGVKEVGLLREGVLVLNHVQEVEAVALALGEVGL